VSPSASGADDFRAVSVSATVSHEAVFA